MCKYSYDRSKHKCQRDNLPDSEYCIFHLQDDKKDLNKFNNGINKIIDEENPINFNGFYFPPGTADFSYKNFQKYVFFGDVIFSGIANFEDAHFIEVNFNGTTFLKIANFEGATFLERARFVGAKFYNKTYFNKANFCSEADFNGAEFLRSEISNIKTTGSLKTKISMENKYPLQIRG
ncbi:MAG: pentapeptide repeat-containing protein [Methanosarcinales archaeon]|nr:pentapeptide repeat-containing protein [Methanosarcinales archaeon]